MDRDGPAGNLIGRLSGGGIDEEAERIDGIGRLHRIEGNETEAAAFFVGLVLAVRDFSNRGIADRSDLDLAAEPIQKLADIGQAVLRAFGVWHAHVVRTPPARITGGEGGRAEGPQAVALLADAVLGRDREVLVAVDGQGPRGARDVDRAMARRVWPRARVEVAREEAIVAAVVCGDGGKDGLAADGVERVPAPVLRPLFKLRFLTFAE